MSAVPQLELPWASRLERAFWAFHRANPHIYRELERRALALHRAKPRLRFGVAVLWESMRYDDAIQSTGDVFKLNQNWRSRYGRLLMAKRPELAGVIRTRELKS